MKGSGSLARSVTQGFTCHVFVCACVCQLFDEVILFASLAHATVPDIIYISESRGGRVRLLLYEHAART